MHIEQQLVMWANPDADDSFPTGRSFVADFGANRRCKMTLENNGELVLSSFNHATDQWEMVWKSTSWENNLPVSDYYLHFQRGKNLVIYEGDPNKPERKAIWASRTQRTGGNKLYIRDDCNLVMEADEDLIVWTTD